MKQLQIDHIFEKKQQYSFTPVEIMECDANNKLGM